MRRIDHQEQKRTEKTLTPDIQMQQGRILLDHIRNVASSFRKNLVLYPKHQELKSNRQYQSDNLFHAYPKETKKKKRESVSFIANERGIKGGEYTLTSNIERT